jgi:hypothetical protein
MRIPGPGGAHIAFFAMCARKDRGLRQRIDPVGHGFLLRTRFARKTNSDRSGLFVVKPATPDLLSPARGDLFEFQGLDPGFEFDPNRSSKILYSPKIF